MAGASGPRRISRLEVAERLLMAAALLVGCATTPARPLREQAPPDGHPETFKAFKWQHQRPACPAFGRQRAGQGDQFRLGLAIEDASSGGVR